MRVFLLIALLGTLPVQAMAQRQVAVADGETIPNLRPCIDYAGEGWLKMTGEMTPDPDPEAIVDHPTYHFRFTQRRAWFGASRPQPFKLYQPGHALRRVDVKEAVVFVHDRPGGVAFDGWQWIWTDRRGRKFIPVFEWPEPAYRNDWQPLALRRFARRVDYADPQPNWPDFEVSEHQLLDDEDRAEQDRLFETRHHRFRIRYGLYLTDLPAMFAAANAEEDCWR